MEIFTFKILKLSTNWISDEQSEAVAKICKKHGGFYNSRAGTIPAGYVWPITKQAEFDACVQELQELEKL